MISGVQIPYNRKVVVFLCLLLGALVYTLELGLELSTAYIIEITRTNETCPSICTIQIDMPPRFTATKSHSIRQITRPIAFTLLLQQLARTWVCLPLLPLRFLLHPLLPFSLCLQQLLLLLLQLPQLLTFLPCEP